MPSFYRCWAALVSLTWVSACGMIPDRTDDYQHERREGALRVPDFYDSSQLDDRFPAGRATQAFIPSEEGFRVPRPPEPGSELFLEQFSLNAVGDDQWLLVTEPVGKIWPALLDYWIDAGAEVDSPDGTAGQVRVRLDPNSLKARKLAETLSLPIDSIGEMGSRIEPGIQRNTSEIRMQVQEGGEWLSGDSPVITQLLTDLQNYLKSRKGSLESYSLAAQGLSGGARVQLVTQNIDEPAYLSVDLGYERTWSAVGQALLQGQVNLVDLNRSSGEYYVNYAVNPEDLEEGFFDGLLGSDEDGRLSDQYNYRVLVQQDGDQSRVTVLSADGGVQGRDGLSLLNLILEHLS